MPQSTAAPSVAVVPVPAKEAPMLRLARLPISRPAA